MDPQGTQWGVKILVGRCEDLCVNHILPIEGTYLPNVQTSSEVMWIHCNQQTPPAKPVGSRPPESVQLIPRDPVVAPQVRLDPNMAPTPVPLKRNEGTAGSLRDVRPKVPVWAAFFVLAHVILRGFGMAAYCSIECCGRSMKKPRPQDRTLAHVTWTSRGFGMATSTECWKKPRPCSSDRTSPRCQWSRRPLGSCWGSQVESTAWIPSLSQYWVDSVDFEVSQKQDWMIYPLPISSSFLGGERRLRRLEGGLRIQEMPDTHVWTYSIYIKRMKYNILYDR